MDLNNIGGFVGNAYGAVKITNCHASGPVQGLDQIGGFVGNVNGDGSKISNCSATGNVQGDDSVGGFAGLNNLGSGITDCYATGNVNATGTGVGMTGGFVGRNDDDTLGDVTVIQRCYASGDVSGASTLGGFAGSNGYTAIARILDCYALGDVSGTGFYAGGFLGTGYDGPVERCYSTGMPSAMTGDAGGFAGRVENAAASLYHDNRWDIETSGFIAGIGDGFPADIEGNSTSQLLEQNTYQGFDFTNVWWILNGETRPFLRMEWGQEIRNSHQLQMIRMKNQFMDYALVNDLNLADILDPSQMWGTSPSSGRGFFPIPLYSDVTFEGHGYTITGLYVNRPTHPFPVGLFGRIGLAWAPVTTVGNLNLLQVNITGQFSVGGFVGSAINAIIHNATVEGRVTGETYVGGVVGDSMTLLDSSFTGEVVGTFLHTGGIVGTTSGPVRNCHSYATVTGIDSVGGLIGSNTGQVQNSSSSVNVSGNENVGGLIGGNSGTVENSTSAGAITGVRNMGGLIGYSDTVNLSAFGCAFNGTVNNTWRYAGGLVGVLSFSSISNCTASGWVNSTGQSGGLVGWNYGGVIAYSQYLGYVIGNENAGGVVGWNENGAIVHNCTSSGIVQATDMVGGIAGYNSGSIWDSSSSSEVNGSNSIGGLVGWNDDTVRDSTFMGTVDGVEAVGGLIGYNLGSVLHSYADGLITGANLGQRVGGLVGYNAGSVSESHTSGKVTCIGSSQRIGGLVGDNMGTVTYSYSTAEVSGYSRAGGLLGWNTGSVSNCFATGDVSLTSGVNGGFGGFIGYAVNGMIINCYSTGNVTGTASNPGFGGFVGFTNDGMIVNSYSIGAVFWQSAPHPTDKGFVGSVIGGTLSNCFWDTETSGQSTSSGEAAGEVEGKTTAEMKTKSTFTDAGWDFTDVWYMRNGVMYPVLQWQVAHDPIRINSNADFTPANGVTGGDGSPGNPWTIDGWVIDGTGYGYGIYIGNTTEHFTVRDCILRNASGGDFSNYFPDSGLVLYNAGNGTIANNVAVGNGWHGIFLYLSGNNIITGNNASHNSMGIRLEHSDGNIVANNTAMYNDQDGLLLYHSESNEVVNNDFFYNQMGIGIYNSATNNITANNLSHNSDDGIYISDASNNTLRQNMISGNMQGISIQIGCTDNVLYHNSFINNMFQAVDYGANHWDHGYPSGGNYWGNYAGIDIYNGPLQNLPGGDGLGDAKYLIGGDGGGVDNYPLIHPWFPDTEPPVAIAGPDQDVDEDAEMQFDGTASTDNNGICNYTWTFTDGGPVAIYGPMPLYTFVQPGNYTVTLTVRDRAGNTDTDAMTVNVRDITWPQPEPTLPASADEGQNVLFNGSLSSDNVGIVNYTWTFDDGGPVTLYGIFVNYSFTTPGIYWVSLTVRDAAGHSSGSSVPITINDTYAPVADAGPEQNVDEDSVVQFDGTGSTDSGGIANYTWTFTDGISRTLYGSMPTYVFNTPGNYTVTLTVRDAAGHTDSDTVQINVRDVTLPVANAGADDVILEGNNYQLNGAASYDNVEIVNYTWNFTYDGSMVYLYSSIPWFTFDIHGVYAITLTVKDAAGNTRSDTMVLTVRETTPPVANAGPDQAVDEDTAVTFDGSGSMDNVGIVNWTWQSIDGGFAFYGETVQFTIETPGTYTVYLRVTDAAGNWAEDSMAVTVRDITPPAVDAGPGSNAYQYISYVLYAASCTDNVGVTDYEWSFTHDGILITREGQSTSFVFEIAGDYVITLTATDAAGNSASDTMVLTVIDKENPVANAGGSQTVPAGTLVTLNGTGSLDNVGIVNYTWSFPYDGGLVNLYGAMVTFLFDIPGQYTVHFWVTDGAWNVDTATITITVTAVDGGGGNDEGDTFPMTIGPVLDPAGNPIAGAAVTLVINETSYTGVTNATGYAVISVPRDSVGHDAEVEITRDGYDTISYTTTLGADGTLADAPPAMDEAEPEPETPDGGGLSNLTWIILIVIIVAVLGIVAFLMMGKAGAPKEAGPEEAVTEPEAPAKQDTVETESPAPETEDSLDDLEL
jgi:parallel beta-helix repeat protein